MTGTLICDEDGLYDPRTFNDRLLLGMKGQMSEAELHFIKARLRGGIVSKARRGELITPLPVGLAYDAAGHVILDPDTAVRGAVAHLFATFAATGSASACVKAFNAAGLSFPWRHRAGPRKGEIDWKPLAHHVVLRILHNPRYAGAFTFGRHRDIKLPGGKLSRTMLPREEWISFIPGAHPGYLTLEQYDANRARLAANAAAHGRDRAAGPPREGPALLQGIIICGTCGQRMTVRYHQRGDQQVPTYVCQRDGISHARRICQAIPGAGLDQQIGCCPALKMPTRAAFMMPMENRANRAAWWARCRPHRQGAAIRGRRRAGCARETTAAGDVDVSRQARAGNGAAGSAGRGQAQQLAAGQHGDPRPRAGLRQGEPVTQGHRSGPQGVERGGELIRAGLSGQGVGVKGDDGLDAHGPQAMGGGAGAPDPAAYRAVRDGELARDEPVPASLGGGDQGLADQGGAVSAARQQARVEHDVGDLAAGAAGPVRARRQQGAAQLADRAFPGPPPWPQGRAAVRAGQLAAGQRIPGRRGVEDLEHRPSRQVRPWPPSAGRGQLVLQPGTGSCLAQPDRPDHPGPGTDPTPEPPPSRQLQVTAAAGRSSARCRRLPARLARASHRHNQRRCRPKP